MNATNRYLNRLAKLKALRNDLAIAKFLGVSAQNVSNWRHELAQLSDDMAFRVAHELQIDPIEIVSAIGAERAKEKATRDGWREVFRRVTHDAQAVLLLVAILAGVMFAHVENTAPQAFESVGAPAPTGQFLTSTYEYYVKPHPLERVAAGAASSPAVPVAVLVLLMALATGRRRRL